MNEPPGARFRVGHAALTMAEYFRDDEHRDVLLLVDNIFRFIQAGTEVSGLMGQMPSRLGYQPTMGTELAGLEERIANTDSGAITSIQAVYVPADDFTDPAAVHTFSHLSASIVLSRKRASEGLYPVDRSAAVELARWPRRASSAQRHYALAQEIRQHAGAVREAQGHHRDARPRAAVAAPTARSSARARRLERFLTQPFFTTEQFTGLQRQARQPGGCARRLRTHPARRIQRPARERAVHDRRDRRGEGKACIDARPPRRAGAEAGATAPTGACAAAPADAT